MIVYAGYKGKKHVATITGTDSPEPLWALVYYEPDGLEVWDVRLSLNAAKAAWRRVDGPGTRWRPH